MISFKNKSTRGQSENRQSVGERTRTPKFPSYQARNGSQQRHLFMTSLLLQEALLSSQTNSTVIHLSCNSAGAYQMAEMTAFREFLCKQMKVPLPLRLQLLREELDHTLFLSNLVFLNSNLQFLKTFLQLPNFSPSVFALFKRLNIWRNNIFVLIWFFFFLLARIRFRVIGFWESADYRVMVRSWCVMLKILNKCPILYFIHLLFLFNT